MLAVDALVFRNLLLQEVPHRRELLVSLRLQRLDEAHHLSVALLGLIQLVSELNPCLVAQDYLLFQVLQLDRHLLGGEALLFLKVPDLLFTLADLTHVFVSCTL